MTNEQYKILNKYEKNLMMAYKSKQLSALPSHDVMKLAVVFEELGYHLDNRSCGHCVMQMCAKLGELYIKYNESQEKVEDTKKVANTTKVKVTKKPSTKKNIRKNKNEQSEK